MTCASDLKKTTEHSNVTGTVQYVALIVGVSNEQIEPADVRRTAEVSEYGDTGDNDAFE